MGNDGSRDPVIVGDTVGTIEPWTVGTVEVSTVEIEEGEVVRRSEDDAVVGIAVACTVGRNEGGEVKIGGECWDGSPVGWLGFLVGCEEGWFVGWDEGIKITLVGSEEG